MPGREELPDTLRRSPAKAQRTWIKAHDAAVEQYGEGERAHRTAFAALKHTYEKVDDRWVAKDEPGPSDPRSTKPTAQKRRGVGETFGGIDYYGRPNLKSLEPDTADTRPVNHRCGGALDKVAAAV